MEHKYWRQGRRRLWLALGLLGGGWLLDGLSFEVGSGLLLLLGLGLMLAGLVQFIFYVR